MFQRPNRRKAAQFTLRKGQFLLVGNSHRLYLRWDKSTGAIGVRGRRSDQWRGVNEGENVDIAADVSFKAEFARGSGDRLKVTVLELIRYPVSVMSEGDC